MFWIDYKGLFLGLMFAFLLSGCQQSAYSQAAPPRPPEIELTSAELSWIGDQIFRNECAAKKACLVHWNEGEAFPSMGIGHFIWYPGNVDGPFVESFPAMIDYLSRQGADLPDWLAGLDPFDAPWPDREAFLQKSDTAQVRELQNFLMASRGLQASYLAQRAREALGRVIAAAPESDRDRLSARIEALLRTPGGVYAVIDYVNFKGEGLVSTERYKGEGWGLLQVLQSMDDSSAAVPLDAFRESAAKVLTRRAENSGRAIEKERWLAGWLNRLQSYREPK